MKQQKEKNMVIRNIGSIVAASLASGVVAAAVLVAGPVAGAQEHVITGTVLLAFAGSWALVVALSSRYTDQPQRWAAAPTAYLALMGGGLLLVAPGDAAINAMGWAWPVVLLALVLWMTVQARRNLRSRAGRWLVYSASGLYALSALGGAYQTVSTSMDARVSGEPGLVDVEGHRLFLSCVGTGTPTVVLESGLGEASSYWGWITPRVASATKVCSYDRAGRGGSDPAPLPQDGVGVATDLHTLLDRAHVAGPFVLVGHSSGADYVRIFAGRYPEQVAGVVLLDGQPAEALSRLPGFAALYRFLLRPVTAVFPSLARLGGMRLIYRAGFGGLPAEVRAIHRANYSSTRIYRGLRDEFAELPTILAQADAIQSFGNRPLIVVTAARDAMVGWLPLQDEMAALSTNSIHRVLPNVTHASLVEDEGDSKAASQAIREVIRAVQSGQRLAAERN